MSVPDPFNAAVVRQTPTPGAMPPGACPLTGQDSCERKSCPRCGGRVNHIVQPLRYVCWRCNLTLWPYPHQVPRDPFAPPTTS